MGLLSSLSVSQPTDFVSVKTYGAQGDWNPQTQTGTDDRAAITAAAAAAIAADLALVFPPGNYHVSKYVPIIGANGLKIRGSAFATIYYGSDDATTIYDATAVSYGQARAALLVKKSRDVSIDGLSFVGGDITEISNINIGAGIYASKCTGMRVKNCSQRGGYSLFVQDAYPDSASFTGNTLAVSAGIMTLTNDGDTNYAFHGGMVGRTIRVSNATNAINNGVFPVLAVLSSTQLQYANASGVAESGTALVWTTEDGDSDTVLEGCTSINARGVSYTGPSSTYVDCTIERQMTHDQPGVPDAFTDNGATTTITDATGRVTKAQIGSYVKIAGSTSGANDGYYKISAVQQGTQILPCSFTYDNASGVTELAKQDTSTYLIFGGEKTGVGAGANAITNTGGLGVVTFTAAAAIFSPEDVGKSIRLVDPTSAANRGSHMISRYVSSTVIEYVLSGAVTEAYAKPFTIDSFDSRREDSAIGPLLTSSSTAVAANSLTDGSLSMVTNAYAGRYLEDSAGRHWLIASNTATVFTLAGTGTPTAGAYKAYAGSTRGSTHGIYLFAGRSDITIRGCTFRGVRTTAVKFSGSALPSRNLEVTGCTAIECGAFFIGGADDAQEHTNISIHHNKIIDVSTGRLGWNDQQGIGVYGARNVKIMSNQITATHDAVPALVDSETLGGQYAIFAGRYLAGRSQPLEDVTCDQNTIVAEPNSTSPVRVANSAIHLERIGQRAKWRTASGGATYTLDATGSTVELTDTLAFFHQSNVGDSIELYNSNNAANDGVFTVTEVVSTTKLRFVNSGAPADDTDDQGTYRIKPKAISQNKRGGVCSVSKNQISGYGAGGIDTEACLAPEICGNIFNAVGTAVLESGSVAPRIVGNREITALTSNARIQLSAETTWPFIDDNIITNGALTGGNLAVDGVLSSLRSEMGVGVGGGAAIDYPLCGKRGRMKSTLARAEMVFGFGGELVDGDRIGVNGVTCTYKSTSPDNGTGGTFATMAGFLLLVGSGFTAEDYGTGLVGTPTTGHVRVRLSAPAASADHGYIDTINVLNPTALVVPRNATGGGESILYTRGEGTDVSGGPWTASAAVFTTTNATETVNITGHGLVTGDGPVRLTNSGGALPTGYATGTDYWVVNTGANTLQLATSRANALAGTVVSISDDGTGTHTMTVKLAKRMVVWSMATQKTAGVMIMPDDANAVQQTLGGLYAAKVTADMGTCDVIRTLLSGGADGEFRWVIA